MIFSIAIGLRPSPNEKRALTTSASEPHTFTEESPVSRAIPGVLDTLESAHLGKESRDLDEFYQSVRNNAEGIIGSCPSHDHARSPS
ncbi:hypothetical protein [Paracoccus broussonetiae]|uniref:hypothetical protein n=1 Tax=Paracoccus broussonetiae TaxID=3075834 RepID=UPI0036F2D25A